MDAAVQQQWTRSIYPLQVPSNDFAPAFPTTSPKGAEKASGKQVEPDGTKVAPWHRSVTEHQGNPDFTASQRQVDQRNGMSMQRFVEGVQIHDQSSTTLQKSSPSAASKAEGHGYHPPSHRPANSTSASIDGPRDRHVQNPHVSSSSARSMNLHGINGATSADAASLMSTSSEEGHEHSSNYKTRPSPNGPAVQRTLRRTPRSRRIGSSTSLAGANEAGALVNPVVKENAATSLDANSWKRGAYPLRPGAMESMAMPTESSRAEAPVKQEKTEAMVWRATQEAFTTKLAQDQSSISASNAAASSPSLQETKVNEANGTRPHQTQNGTTTAPKSNPRSRQYPLQAPASVINLQDSLTPPLSPEGNELESLREISTAQLHGNTQAVRANKTWNKRTYPLQSQFSVASLRQSPSPVEESKRFVDADASRSRDPQQIPVKREALRRRGYPLQTPASNANLQFLPSPPPSPEEEMQERQLNATHLHESPLQLPADTHLQKSSLSTPPKIEINSHKPERASPRQSREDEQAARLSWRRESYPVQSENSIAPFQRVLTPQPPETEVYNKARQIHLPRNIHAATDSEQHQFKARTIVVCLDGTGDRFDGDNSNIVHLVSALKKDDASQVTYYQAGIGTYGDGGLSGGFYAAADMAVGASLGLHVRDAYHFLMHTYKEGDRICIFGFSRGAYTARCLAGMIHKVGLLPPRNIQQIAFAYEFYADDTANGWKQSNDFKKTFSVDVSVYFLGCFDSVASVGFIPRQLPLSSTPTNKSRYFRHAMALDERRAKFKVARHKTKTWEEIEKSASPTTKAAASILHHLPHDKSQDDAPPSYFQEKSYSQSSHHNLTREEYNNLTGPEKPFETDVLEVWFAGAHADVGGGAVPNEERHKLSHIPLRWMIRQAFECNTGIIFKTAVLAEFGLDVHTLWPTYSRLSAPALAPPPSFLERYDKTLPPREVRAAKLVPIDQKERGEHFFHLKSHTDEDWTPEQVEDFYDAMAPLNDQLVQALNWWILEVLPVQYKVPQAPGEVVIRTGPNLGRYRGVEDKEPNVHWTVLHRVKHMGYQIRARTAPHTTWKTVV